MSKYPARVKCLTFWLRPQQEYSYNPQSSSHIPQANWPQRVYRGVHLYRYESTS